MRNSDADHTTGLNGKSRSWAIVWTFILLGMLRPNQADAVTAYEAPPGGWTPNSYGLSYTAEYFASNSNYNFNRGAYTSLVNGNNWSSYESHVRARYSLNSLFSFFGGGGFSSVRAVDTGVNKTNTEVTDLFLGVDFLMTKKYVHLIPELQGGYPLDTVTATQTNPLTSDGTPYIRGGLFAYLPTKRFRFGAFSGVHVPLQNLASRFLYEATVDVRIFSFVTMGAGIDGYETLISDQTNYATRIATAVSADAGSERFYAFNPALIEARAWIGVRPSKSFWIRVGYAQSINGMDAAQGQSALLSLAYNSPGDTGHVAFPGGAGKVDADKAVRDFESEMESTEQGIFDDQDAQTQGAVPREAKPKVKQPTDKSLDQTEKLLEQKNQELQQ